MKLEVNEKLLQKVTKAGTAFVLAGSLLLTPQVLSDNVVSAVESNEELENLTVKVGINLYLDDKGFVPRDANGNETYPFILNGTTYVPIRAIAELFNANIDWDENTNTVSINTTGEKSELTHTQRIAQALIDYNINVKKGIKLVVNGNEVIPTDANGNIKDIYVANGTTYVPVRAVSEALGLPITWSSVTNSVFIGKHKTTGLTVENIGDPTYFDECSRKFINFNGGVGDISYVYKGNRSWIKSEMKYSSVYPPEMTMFLLNENYCSEEVINSLFIDYDYDTLNKVEFFFVYLCEFIMAPYCTIEWNECMIEQDKADFLTKVQEAAVKINSKYISTQYTGDASSINALIDEFYYNENAPVHYGQDYFLDYLMSELSILTVREYSNVRDDYDKLGKTTMETRKKVYATIDSAYERTHDKELKQ